MNTNVKLHVQESVLYFPLRKVKPIVENAPFMSAVNGCDSVVSSDSVSVVSLLSSLYREELGTHFLRNVGRVGRPFREGSIHGRCCGEFVRLESSSFHFISFLYLR